MFPPWDILLSERILSYGSMHSIVVVQSVGSELDCQIQALPLMTFSMLISLSLLICKMGMEIINYIYFMRLLQD